MAIMDEIIQEKALDDMEKHLKELNRLAVLLQPPQPAILEKLIDIGLLIDEV